MGKKRKPKLPTARAGLSIRKREVAIRGALKGYHPCPRCKAERVKRLSHGIWQCKKCGFTFGGGAYRPFTDLGRMAERSVSRVG